MTEPLNVMVLGVGGNVSQGILKALAVGNLPVRVVGVCVSPQSMGLYTTDTAYVSPLASHPEFVPWLIETCQRENVQAILTGVESVVSVIAAHKAAIEAATGAVCLVSTPETLAVGDDKLKTCQWLESHSLNTPRYADSSDRSALRGLRDAVGFPLIAKPRSGRSAEGILTVYNDSDLEYVMTRRAYVVEEMLGDADSEYTVGCYVDRHGQVRGSIAMRRALHAGTTVFAEVGDFPEVRAEAERIAAALKPVASCNVQMRMHREHPTAFEINVRFSGTTPMRAHFGFNEVETALRDYVLKQDIPDMPHITSGVAVRYWNELYVSPEALQTLRDSSHLSDPRRFPRTLETYGE
jgi:carbamoyl-phosphate synthase large subunit